MTIVTGSLQNPKKKTDGLRICVMRRIKPEYDFDIWMPSVAPSERLLKKYVIDKKMKWKEFVSRYTKELLKQKVSLQALVRIAQDSKITLLCWEPSEKYCHRSILARELRKRSVV